MSKYCNIEDATAAVVLLDANQYEAITGTNVSSDLFAGGQANLLKTEILD